MMGKSNRTQTTVLRYDPYVEMYHHAHLDRIINFVEHAIIANPYIQFHDHGQWNAEDLFFSAGESMASVTSIYGLFRNRIEDYDIANSFNNMTNSTVDGAIVNDAIAAESERLDEDLEENIIPRFELGMRDINSVMVSSFVIGRGLLENTRTRTLSRYAAEARFRVIPLIFERWKITLDWNRAMVESYSQIAKLYVMQRLDVEKHLYELLSKLRLFPLHALSAETAALGAMQAGHSTVADGGGSKLGSVLGGAMSGAAAGASVGGPYGAVVGGVIGFASGLFG